MVIAITGGLGTGKTTVLKIFASLGAATISADDIVHNLLTREDIKIQIGEVFGRGVFSGDVIDRKALASEVFSSEKKRKELEAILHPHVFDEIEAFIKAHKGRNIVVEIPLLFETGSQNRYDRVITVTADRDVVIKRLREKGMDLEEVRQRLSHQMPIEEKIKRSDFVIDNSDGMEKTRRQVERIWKELLER
ncbi:MAG: dephospho-CoA kinase [Nitrospirae bacterium]|nr:dephospho-CoA kinase [Nitrospirota bacterium]